MTETTAVEHVGSIEAADTRSALALLHAAILGLDDQRATLAQQGDVDTLAIGLAQLRELAGHLRDLTVSVEDDVARLMPEKRVEIEGLGVIERRKATDRKAWDWESLWPALIRRTLDPEGDGELPPLPVLVASFTSLTEQVIGLTPSKQPRVTALRGLGFDPDEWCESKPGRATVQIHGSVQ